MAILSGHKVHLTNARKRLRTRDTPHSPPLRATLTALYRVIRLDVTSYYQRLRSGSTEADRSLATEVTRPLLQPNSRIRLSSEVTPLKSRTYNRPHAV